MLKEPVNAWKWKKKYTVNGKRKKYGSCSQQIKMTAVQWNTLTVTKHYKLCFLLGKPTTLHEITTTQYRCITIEFCNGVWNNHLKYVLCVLLFSFILYCFQCEAALAVDSLRLIDKALSQLMVHNPDIVRNTLHNGKFYNNNSEGIDCDSDPVVPWIYGREIMKVLRKVSMHNET